MMFTNDAYKIESKTNAQQFSHSSFHLKKKIGLKFDGLLRINHKRNKQREHKFLVHRHDDIWNWEGNVQEYVTIVIFVNQVEKIEYFNESKVSSLSFNANKLYFYYFKVCVDEKIAKFKSKI